MPTPEESKEWVALTAELAGLLKRIKEKHTKFFDQLVNVSKILGGSRGEDKRLKAYQKIGFNSFERLYLDALKQLEKGEPGEMLKLFQEADKAFKIDTKDRIADEKIVDSLVTFIGASYETLEEWRSILEKYGLLTSEPIS